MKGYRKPLFIGASVLGSLVASILIAEVTLRFLVHYEYFGADSGFTQFVKQTRTLAAWRVPGGLTYFRKSADTRLGWEAIPGVEKGHVRINSDGFRGPEYTLNVPPNTTRIAVIGDSGTFGLALPEADTLSAALARQLNQRILGTTFEALNFGIPGYNTAQEMIVLREKALRYNPDIVVLHYVFNDPEIYDAALVLGPRASAMAHSHLFLGAMYAIKSQQTVRSLRIEATDIVDYYQRLHRSTYFDSSLALITQMGERLHKRGIPFYVVVAPEVIGYPTFDDYPYEAIHQRFAEIASDSITVVDPLAEFKRRWTDPKALWVTEFDCHKNADGIGVIANELATHIARALPVEAGAPENRAIPQ